MKSPSICFVRAQPHLAATRMAAKNAEPFMLGGDTGLNPLVRYTPSHSDALGVKVILPARIKCKQEAKSTHNESLYPGIYGSKP
jgi:hypothetical protein